MEYEQMVDTLSHSSHSNSEVVLLAMKTRDMQLLSPKYTCGHVGTQIYQ